MHNSNQYENVFLKNDVSLEPLICRWNAWPHLLAPVQSAMNITFRQLPLLHSFVTNPSLHLAAARDPKMIGGPFVSLPIANTSDVQDLISIMEHDCEALISLARDLRGFDEILQTTAKGHSLKELYKTLPTSLHGLVELNYDINHHPKIRILEELLPYTIHNQLQEISISIGNDNERPFFMTTPRLRRDDTLSLRMSFEDTRLDALFSMRTNAASLDAVAELLEIDKASRSLFDSFFTTRPPTKVRRRVAHDGVKVSYFGHACILFESHGVTILVDPTFSWNAGGDGRFTFADLPHHLDYVIITHGHHDHFCPEALLHLRHRVDSIIVPSNNSGSITDPSLKIMLQHLGYNDIRVVRPLDKVQFDGGEIVSLPFPGEHCDLDIFSKQTVYIHLNGKHFVLLADSDGWDRILYRRIHEFIGTKVDALFLGMECNGAPLSWLYGPLLTTPIRRRDDESRRLSAANGERAWNAIREIRASKVYIYAMGREPWLRYLMGLEYSKDSVQSKEIGWLISECERALQNIQQLEVSHQEAW